MVEHDADTLITSYIELNPLRPGDADAQLRESGIAVWALIGAFIETPGDRRTAAELVARAFDIPVEAMSAAILYYKAHQAEIDARLGELNAA